MNHARLHALTDGIFAIVMTLLVLELKVPVLHHATNEQVWDLIRSQSPIFLSYFISFTVLFVYWRAHNFVITILAKNIDVNLLTINGVFLFLVGLVPFSTQVLGEYSSSPLAISIYAINIALIGFVILFMRIYVEKSASIENLERTKEQRLGALIRTITPIACSLLAIPLSLISTKAAFIILLFAVFYNFINNAADITRKLFIRPVLKVKKLLLGHSD